MGCFSSCHCCCYKKTSKKIILLLVGLDNAGKTTALKGLSGESTENVIPSVGFSSTSLRYKGHTVQIYDLGGGSGIRGIWSKYFTDVHGVIFVVDASDIERVEECRLELERLLRHEKLTAKPVLLLANKQDLPGALDELDLVERLGLEPLVNQQKCPTSVETCAAGLSPDPAVQNGYKWLLETILQQFSVLDSRVCADRETQRLEEERLQHERRLRVEKLREKREASNGHTNPPDEDDTRNPFRPISELTADAGTNLILVQQSPTNNGSQLIKDGSREELKKPGLFSRKNKTAPLQETSPVRKVTTLPPLKQTVGVPAEPVPWLKPVLSTTTTHRTERAWGLDEELEPVHTESKRTGTVQNGETFATKF